MYEVYDLFTRYKNGVFCSWLLALWSSASDTEAYNYISELLCCAQYFIARSSHRMIETIRFNGSFYGVEKQFARASSVHVKKLQFTAHKKLSLVSD